MRTVFPTPEGDADSFTSNGGVHYFRSSKSAYDACQICEEIEDGDILVIEREGVVGVADTWPFAVTTEVGALHTLGPGQRARQVEIDAGLPKGSVARAIDIAQGMNLPTINLMS